MSIPKQERPKLYDPSRGSSWQAIGHLRHRHDIRIVDTFSGQLAELFLIERPALIRREKKDVAAAIRSLLQSRAEQSPLERQGTWAFYPWLNTLVHVLDEESFQKVRTNRNADLITFEEQKKFYDTAVGIAGLSVGSNIALTIVLQGGARHIRLADFDALELSNTNRLIAGVHQLGLPKTTIIARKIWEINPYAQIDIFGQGLNKENVDAFMKGLDVVVDEMDDFVIKQRLRELARKYRIPLLSAADNGDRSTVDVERHDLKERTPYFLGRLGKTSVAKFGRLLGDKAGIVREITRLIGADNVPPRLQASLPNIGTTLVSVPQLGGTALMGAAVVTYCIRKIVAGQELPSGRSHVCIDEKLVPGYFSARAVKERKRRTRALEESYMG